MVKARKYVVKKRFEGVPKRDDFEIVEYELPPLKDGEFLVKAEWISVDPYLRTYVPYEWTSTDSFTLKYRPSEHQPYDQVGYQVGIVKESKSTKYPVGIRVVTHKGWCDYSIVSEADETSKSMSVLYKLPNMEGLSIGLGVGAVGMPGVTAYFGFLEKCRPKPGETVVVTGAAGAVGSIVGQIAKIKGCKVIGFAGSDEKVTFLEKELGFDKAFNYKTVDVEAALKQAAPNGIGSYFDNVGGEISSIIMNQMNRRGRVVVCGFISSYNEDPKQIAKASILQKPILHNNLIVESVGVMNYFRPKNRWPEAMFDLIKWIKNGEIRPVQHVTKGFDKLYDAFVGMLAGENIGKAVVQV